MAQITDFEKQQDLKALETLLNELDISAQFYTEGNLFPALCLVSILPTSYQSKELPEKGETEDSQEETLAFSYIFQIDEEDDALTKQLLTYCMINHDLSGLDPLALYQAVNALNIHMSSGYFVLESSEENGHLSLEYRFIISAPVGTPFSDECFFQSLTEMTFAADTAAAMLDIMKSGKTYQEFFDNPNAFL